MSVASVEARWVIGIMRVDESGLRPLDQDELAEFVSDFADELIEDSRTINPVVSGDAGPSEIEIVFGLEAPVNDPSTDVKVFDIVTDAARTLGAEWRNAPQPKRIRRKPPATTKMTRQSTILEPSDELVNA